MATAGGATQMVNMVAPCSNAVPCQKIQGNGPDFSKTVTINGVSTPVIPGTHIQTSPQAKVLMHMSGQMTVNQARNAVRTGKYRSQMLKILTGYNCISLFKVTNTYNMVSI